MCLIGALTAAPAYAETEADRATARELAQEGQAAFDKGEYAVAADRFARADALVHAPTLLLALGRAQAKLGRLVQAYESYSRIVREGVPDGASKVFKKAVEEAKREVEPIKARLAWATIQVQGPSASSAKVTVDADQVPAAALGVRRAVNPGDHVLRAEAEGFAPAEKPFHVSEGETVTLELALEPSKEAPASTGAGAPPPAPSAPVTKAAPPADSESGSGRRTFAFVALGVGAAGLTVGAITGVLAMRKHSDLEDACPDGRCPPGEQNDLDAYRTLGTVSTVGFVVAGVGAAAGLTLLLTAPKREPETASVELGFGVAGVSARGRF
jgi:hypothetical protein